MRDTEIRREVKEYLEKTEKLMPSLEAVGMLPEESMGGLAWPEKPDCLIQLEEMEAWGFPNQGTYLDQPAGFWRDVGQAKFAREMFQLKKASQERLTTKIEDVFASAPPFEELT